jgi:uncharacterized protein YjbJ (UPF0337 family)
MKKPEARVNWDQVEGNWKQWQGAIQRQWGKLTNDDLDVIRGDRTRLTGILQERYGREKEELEREIEQFVKDLR